MLEDELAEAKAELLEAQKKLFKAGISEARAIAERDAARELIVELKALLAQERAPVKPWWRRWFE
jgi:hypothetical protein